MNYRGVMLEKILPLFTGTLGSLFFCALILSNTSVYKIPDPPVIEISVENELIKDGVHFLSRASEKVPDIVLEMYKNPEYRIWVMDFFTDVCSNRDVAQAILDSTVEFNVPPSLAFALGWEESKFNPRAVNRRNLNGSVDRGLFQLNDQSFPNLEVPDFFSIKTNARYGVSHLKYFLDTGVSEITALAMYNAGTGRVRNSGTPKVTLDYVSRILENQRKIENHFHARFIREEEARLSEEKSENPEKHQSNRVLSSASPL